MWWVMWQKSNRYQIMWSDRDYHVMWHVTCGGYRLNTNLGDLYNFWSSLISELVSGPSNKPITWQIFNHVVNMILCFLQSAWIKKSQIIYFPDFQFLPRFGKIFKILTFSKSSFFQILYILKPLSRGLTYSNHGNFLRLGSTLTATVQWGYLSDKKRVVLLNCHDVIGCQFWIHKRLKDINSFI